MERKSQIVKSSGLARGNVVRNNGMRILLDGDPHEYDRDGEYGMVRSFPGLVLNIEEVDDPWIVRMSRDCDGVLDGDEDVHRWRIQGNDLATWQVEACEYFLLCTNNAVGTVPNPIIGPVPSCQRCADQVGATIDPFTLTNTKGH